ncbi:MAG: alkaline phosphatase family protein [Bryobacteraceae bacterium]
MIGLDSADRSLVEHWCDSGDMPVLRKLRDQGAWGRLETPPGLADDSLWASFATATSPGRHGRFFWRAVKSGSYETELCRYQPPPVSPFWVALSESGKRVAVIDVPKCPLTPGINGIQICDWLTHGRDYPETCSHPADLAEQVIERFGADHTDRPQSEWMCWMEALPPERMPEFRRHAIESIERKTRLCLELLEQGGWDLFLAVFKEAHCIGHQCWPLLGSQDDPVKAVYRELDRAVGALVERAGPDARVIVFSDAGMSSNETGEHFLDILLQQLESHLITMRQRVRRKWRRSDAHPQAGRLFYPLEHNEISGAVRFNLIGREPSGLVRRGSEEQTLRRRLTAELLALRDPGSGQPVVEAVLDSNEVFPGGERERLPDVFVVWARRGPLVGAASSTLGELHAGPHKFRPGNHVSGGFYVASGPGIANGRYDAALIDLAPTAARVLGVDFIGRDGRAIAAMTGSV